MIGGLFASKWCLLLCCRTGIIEVPINGDVGMLKRLFQYQAHNKLLPALQVCDTAHDCSNINLFMLYVLAAAAVHVQTTNSWYCEPCTPQVNTVLLIGIVACCFVGRLC